MNATQNERLTAILTHRLTNDGVMEFKSIVSELEGLGVVISKDYFKGIVECWTTEHDNRLYQLINRSCAKVVKQNRYFKVFNFGYKPIRTRESLSFISFA